MEKSKVLLIDDDMMFGQIAVKILQVAGYDVYFQNTLFGIENTIMKLCPNIIILDVMIGDENSLERINDIRLAAEDIPIIFISSFGDLALKEKAANNGAMIYLEKPFDKNELLMWVNRYARRNEICNTHTLKIGSFSMDLDAHVLYYDNDNDNNQTLSNTEYSTFKLLFINKGEVVTREELKDAVWGNLICSDENLNNVIHKLRRYFERDSTIHIETLRGEGFKMWIS